MKKKKEKKKSSFFADFKAFLSRGNVLNLAVAVVIGAAFGKIVSALVDQIIMPMLSLILGGINFSDLKWVIRAADEAAGVSETALGYGLFIQSLIDFFIIAFCIFMAIRLISKTQNKIQDMKKKAEDEKKEEEKTEEVETTPVAPAPPPPPTQEELLTEIRDLLKAGSLTQNEERRTQNDG